MGFEPVPQRPDLPKMEDRVLRRWQDREIFRKSVERTAGGSLFRFYDGPPTANGRPGVHHVEARVFKDAFPRYRTMKGEHVPRKAGWDCHGIPVELEVERELGFTAKSDIERFGVEEFNARCRESVTRYVDEFRRLSERVGYWVDTDDAYWTMSDQYIESVWWSLRSLFDQGLIYQDYRVAPYCPRCGTALSDHEVAQGYRDVEDVSVYVRLPLLTGPLSPGGTGLDDRDREHGASLLVWTTMPWTFIATTAAVVGADIRYVLARGGHAGDRPVVLAEERLDAALGEGAEVIRPIGLDEILGARYQGPFDLVGPGSPAEPDGDPASWRLVVTGDFVTTDQGSGIVSTGAAFGVDDLRVAKDNGLPVVNPVAPDGRFDATTGPYSGLHVRVADEQIVKDLRSSGLLVHAHSYAHSYPFCWRCDTALLYYAKPSWYISTSRFRDRMLSDNSGVDWRPPHIRDGRYGDWLRNNVDWALSRERYWGTPLPIWRCTECLHTVAVGSRTELAELTGADVADLDLHRPFVDRIEFDCPKCSATMRRVPEVIDAWYDSGAMPFAQFGYPHVPGSDDQFASMFPADYICEGIDQTRGWFYSLQAIATTLFGTGAYRRALCLGHIVDQNGRKMSKSAGNVISPWELIDHYGADALRWLLLVEGNPWQPRRMGTAPLQEITRRLLLTIWNTYYFFVSNANLAGWTPGDSPVPLAARPIMDRYVLAELADTVKTVDRAMADFDATTAGQRISDFVEDLSNWYVRRSRSRFAGDGPGQRSTDCEAAFATLYTCLTTLAGLLAPLTPFLADELYEGLVRSVAETAPESVHLTAFPGHDEQATDDVLRAAMTVARRVVTLGRDARQAAGIAVRQPLRLCLVTVPAADEPLFDLVREVIGAELNVKDVRLVGSQQGGGTSSELKPDFRTLGKSFGKGTPAVARAIQEADATQAVQALRTTGELALTVDGSPVTVTADHVQVIEKPLAGWQASADGPYSCALDLEIDNQLREEGLAREFVRVVNDLRKRAGLERGDRIVLDVAVEDDPRDELQSMVRSHLTRILRDVVASSLTWNDRPAVGDDQMILLGDGRVRVALRAAADHCENDVAPCECARASTSVS